MFPPAILSVVRLLCGGRDAGAPAYMPVPGEETDEFNDHIVGLIKVAGKHARPANSSRAKREPLLLGCQAMRVHRPQRNHLGLSESSLEVGS